MAQACDGRRSQDRAREAALPVLTEAEEPMIVAVPRHRLLPPDGCLHSIEPSVPHLTRSAPHRSLQWHGTSRRQDIDGPSLDIATQYTALQRIRRFAKYICHQGVSSTQTSQKFGR